MASIVKDRNPHIQYAINWGGLRFYFAIANRFIPYGLFIVWRKTQKLPRVGTVHGFYRGIS